MKKSTHFTYVLYLWVQYVNYWRFWTALGTMVSRINIFRFGSYVIPVVILARWLVWLYEWRWWFKCNNDITVRQYNTLDFSPNHQTPGGFWIYGSAFWHARLFIIHWRFWNCFWLNVDNVIRTSRIQSWNSTNSRIVHKRENEMNQNGYWKIQLVDSLHVIDYKDTCH